MTVALDLTEQMFKAPTSLIMPTAEIRSCCG